MLGCAWVLLTHVFMSTSITGSGKLFLAMHAFRFVFMEICTILFVSLSIEGTREWACAMFTFKCRLGFSFPPVVSNFNIVKRRLPGQASIYTAELCAILLALDVVNNSNEDKYIMCVDSLSCLQAIEHQHIDHPLVLDVLDKCSALINKTVLFCWVPSHVGIRGNELADAATKAALNEALTIMTLPYSDFKPLVKRFIRGKWSDFRATQINNKLHSVQPALGCGSLSNRDRRREQLVLD